VGETLHIELALGIKLWFLGDGDGLKCDRFMALWKRVQALMQFHVLTCAAQNPTTSSTGHVFICTSTYLPTWWMAVVLSAVSYLVVHVLIWLLIILYPWIEAGAGNYLVWQIRCQTSSD
jgi:hypothetical protein